MSKNLEAKNMHLLKKLMILHLSVNDDKIVQSFSSIETYAYRTNKEIIHKKE